MRRFSLPHPLPYTSSPPIIYPLGRTLYLSPAFHCLKIIFKKVAKLFVMEYTECLLKKILVRCAVYFGPSKNCVRLNHNLLFLTFLYQGKGVFGNFEKSKLNPIPNKKDDVSLEDLDVINFNFCFNTLMYNLYNIKFCY